jgi:hypothetical protein
MRRWERIFKLLLKDTLCFLDQKKTFLCTFISICVARSFNVIGDNIEKDFQNSNIKVLFNEE